MFHKMEWCPKLLVEVLGMSLPGCGTALAVEAKRRSLAISAGKQIIQVLRSGLTRSRIMSREALENAIAAV